MLPIRLDEFADLQYLGAEQSDVRRVIQRMANQHLLDSVLDGNARPTELLLSNYEMRGEPQSDTSDSVSGRAAATQSTTSLTDREFAILALEEARKSVSEDDVRAHPKVGAVVARNGLVLSRAHRGEVPGNHAEFVAVEKKLSEASVAGATVYTTLEPCTTRNPPKIPCVRRLIDRKVARVVIGMLDPDVRIRGLGVQALREANIEVALFPSDLMAMVEELNRDFTRHHLQAQTSPVEKASEQEPTLLVLMKKAFPHYHQLHGKAVLTFGDEAALEVKDTLYLDFDAGSKFIGFFVPSSQRPLEACAALAQYCRRRVEELAQGLSITARSPGENAQDVHSLIFTGRVFLYHEDMLTHRQIADVEDVFKKEGLNVVLRGPDYLTPAWLQWKRNSEKTSH